jgi:hypothetical protein
VVAHDHGDTTPAERSRIPQAAKEHRERREAQVGFGLAAASGEKEQVYQFAIRVLGLRHGGEIQQQKSQLKGTPLRWFQRVLAALTAHRRHNLVGETEGL